MELNIRITAAYDRCLNKNKIPLCMMRNINRITDLNRKILLYESTDRNLFDQLFLYHPGNMHVLAYQEINKN